MNTTLEKASLLKAGYLTKRSSIRKTDYKIKCKHFDFHLTDI